MGVHGTIERQQKFEEILFTPEYKLSTLGGQYKIGSYLDIVDTFLL